MRKLLAAIVLALLPSVVHAQIVVTPPSGGGTPTFPITAPTGGALQTGTTTGNTLILKAYDVDGAAYTDLLTLTAGNTPTMTGLFGAGSLSAPGVAVGLSSSGMYSGSGFIAFSYNGEKQVGFYQSTAQFTYPLQLQGNTILSGDATATLQLGSDVNGAAVAQTLKSHDGITGTDVAGANLTLAAGRGTGAGAPGNLIFQTATALGSGNTAQTLATRFTITPTAFLVGTANMFSAGTLYYDGDSNNDGTFVASEVTITNADTYYQFTATTAGAAIGDVTASATSDDLTVAVAGTYLVNFSASFYPAIASKDIIWALFKEGTIVSQCKTSRGTASGAAGSASFVCHVAATANDSFDIRVMNSTDGTEIEVEMLQLAITRVGG